MGGLGVSGLSFPGIKITALGQARELVSKRRCDHQHLLRKVGGAHVGVSSGSLCLGPNPPTLHLRERLGRRSGRQMCDPWPAPAWARAVAGTAPTVVRRSVTSSALWERTRWALLETWTLPERRRPAGYQADIVSSRPAEFCSSELFGNLGSKPCPTCTLRMLSFRDIDFVLPKHFEKHAGTVSPGPRRAKLEAAPAGQTHPK